MRQSRQETSNRRGPLLPEESAAPARRQKFRLHDRAKTLRPPPRRGHNENPASHFHRRDCRSSPRRTEAIVDPSRERNARSTNFSRFRRRNRRRLRVLPMRTVWACRNESFFFRKRFFPLPERAKGSRSPEQLPAENGRPQRAANLFPSKLALPGWQRLPR